MEREKENTLLMIASRWEAICDVLDGNEPSDFMMSFPEVRQVADLYVFSQQSVQADAEMKCIKFETCKDVYAIGPSMCNGCADRTA